MATNTASSSQNTRPTGSALRSASTPAKIAPAARPLSGATTPVRAPCQSRSGGWRSSSAALMQPMATPVARPWRMRAANSQTTLGATANTSMATISTTSAASSTGRRPRWSDNEPATSSALSSATA